MSTANEILLQMVEAQRRLQPIRKAFERELTQLVRHVHMRLWWRLYLTPYNPQLLLTYCA